MWITQLKFLRVRIKWFVFNFLDLSPTRLNPWCNRERSIQSGRLNQQLVGEGYGDCMCMLLYLKMGTRC